MHKVNRPEPQHDSGLPPPWRLEDFALGEYPEELAAADEALAILKQLQKKESKDE